MWKFVEVPTHPHRNVTETTLSGHVPSGDHGSRHRGRRREHSREIGRLRTGAAALASAAGDARRLDVPTTPAFSPVRLDEIAEMLGLAADETE